MARLKGRDGLTIGIQPDQEGYALTLERDGGMARTELWESLEEALSRASALGCDTKEVES